MAVIYGLYSSDDELRYIGRTAYDLKYAMNRHRASAKKTPLHPPVNVWINEVGLKNFGGKVLSEIDGPDTEVLEAHKKALVAARETINNLLNVTPEEQIKHLKTANTGKTISEEHRAAISKAHTGKTVSEETKAKLSEAAMGHTRNKGQKRSEETKMKMRLAKHNFYHVGKNIYNITCSYCIDQAAPVTKELETIK